MAIDRTELRARIGKNADYYLPRFDKIDAGRKVGWNWSALFLSSAWFSYRRMGGWAALNLIAALLIVVLFPADRFLTLFLIIAYAVAFYLLVPSTPTLCITAGSDRKLPGRRPGKPPKSPTRPVLAAIAGVISIFLPVSLIAVVYVGEWNRYAGRAQVSEAVALLVGAKAPLAEYRANQGKWPADLKEVGENRSGMYTDRVAITEGAGASGPLTITATMKTSGVNASIAGKTVQLRGEDGGKTWTCRRGAVKGVEEKYLPGACR